MTASPVSRPKGPRPTFRTTLTARDLPDARQDFLTWVTGPGGRVLVPKGGPGIVGAIAAATRVAEMYYVNADMTALARTIGRGLDVYGLSNDDLPSTCGFLIWETPATDEVPHGAPIGVMWMSSGLRMSISSLVDARAYRTWADDWGRKNGRSTTADTDLITAGRLVFQGQSVTLPLDCPDQPWAQLGMSSQETMARTLLATWILIRQPADARKSLHQVEEVAAPRAAQKRIQRMGGDPTRTVRMVTLRQSLRSTETDSDTAGHSGRIYRHRWFVRPHRTRQYYPSTGEHQQIWRGPYLVVPAGCEDAPIMGGERVNVLRR